MATILTDNEVDRLNVPVEHLPYAGELVTRLPYAESRLRTEIGQVIGAASMCWAETPSGVFDSDRAKELAENLIAEVILLTGMGEPSLGLASNQELVDELAVRTSCGNTDPGYRTA